MSHTTIDTKRSEWSSDKKDGYTLVTDLKIGDKIWVVIEANEGDDDDGITEKVGIIKNIKTFGTDTFLDFKSIIADESMMLPNNIFVRTY